MVFVDDDGVVQNTAQFFSNTARGARFTIPVTRRGEERFTYQLLIAIATRQPLQTIADLGFDSQLAGDFFTALNDEVGPTARIGVVTLDIR